MTILTRRFVLVACCLAVAATTAATGPAIAQADAELAAQRGSLEREQQSESFALQLRQSQLDLRYPASDGRSLNERQEQQILQDEQLRRLPHEGTAAMARERQAQQFAFGARPPAWGPSLGAPHKWAPTLEPGPRQWTPGLP
jgi:hypothetical protein